MRKLTRRLDTTVQEIRESLDLCVVAEREPSLVANALNQVTWHIYELRRRLAKDLRAQGLSWGEIATTMGISRQSAHRQWHTVDGELEANRLDGYRPRVDLIAMDQLAARARGVDAFVHVAGQLALDAGDEDGPAG